MENNIKIHHHVILDTNDSISTSKYIINQQIIMFFIKSSNKENPTSILTLINHNKLRLHPYLEFLATDLFLRFLMKFFFGSPCLSSHFMFFSLFHDRTKWSLFRSLTYSYFTPWLFFMIFLLFLHLTPFFSSQYSI